VTADISPLTSPHLVFQNLSAPQACRAFNQPLWPQTRSGHISIHQSHALLRHSTCIIQNLFDWRLPASFKQADPASHVRSTPPLIRLSVSNADIYLGGSLDLHTNVRPKMHGPKKQLFIVCGQLAILDFVYANHWHNVYFYNSAAFRLVRQYSVCCRQRSHRWPSEWAQDVLHDKNCYQQNTACVT